MLEMLSDPQIWASFLTLSALEIILGIDNLIFIALLVERIPKRDQKKVRFIGLSLALVMRVLLLLGLSWLMGMTEPLFTLIQEFSGKDLMLLGGGLFLIAKSTLEIHHMVGEGGEEKTKAPKVRSSKVISLILQVVAIDFVFSFDSVITAVGMTTNVPVIVAAMVVAMVVMLFASGPVAHFIQEHPTLKVLALAFILMIGVMLVAEGLHFHVPRGYIYFAMAFSCLVEWINNLVRRGTKGS